MFNQNNGYSLADIAAATGGNNNNGFFGNDGWWIILLFLIWGNNGWGGGWGGNGRSLSVTDGYTLASDYSNLERKMDTINAGLCDGFYAQNTNLLNGFAGVNAGITQAQIAGMQNTNALTAQMTGLSNQFQQCCCDNERLVEGKFADLNYNLATLACQTRQAVADAKSDILENNNEGVREILRYLTEDKIATLQAENAALRSAASQAAQNTYLINALNPTPIPAYQVPNPYAGYGYQGTCGCAANF